MQSRTQSRPSPFFTAKGARVRVDDAGGARINGSAIACLTPSSGKVRVGVLFGPGDDRNANERSVVLTREEAREFAEQLLRMLDASAQPTVLLGRVHHITTQASISVCPAGDCPCGRVRAGCEYHDPTMQPVDPTAANR